MKRHIPGLHSRQHEAGQSFSKACSSFTSMQRPIAGIRRNPFCPFVLSFSSLCRLQHDRFLGGCIAPSERFGS